MEGFKANQMPQMSNYETNVKNIVVRALKFLIEGLAVSAACWALPSKKLQLNEVVLIALTAAAVFAVLDLFAPEVGRGVRQGAGLGIGAGLVGFRGLDVGTGVLPGVPSLV